MMRVVSTFFASSSILHSAKCRLESSEFEHLVVARSSNLEVFVLRPEGAKLHCSLDIWGAISSLSVVYHTDAPDTLLVTTETPDPLAILLEYVPETESSEPFLREYSHSSLHSSHSRPMEFFEGAVVHPSGDVAIVATYVGKLKALVLKGTRRKKIKAEFDCILTELNVLSICFLPVPVFSQTYVLAILHRDYSGKLQLLARDLSIHGQELSMEPSIIFHQVTIDENDASTLVPMPASGDTPAGILVLGGQSILYFEVGARESADKGKGKDKSAKGKGRRKRDSETIGSGTEPRAQIDWPLCDITSYALIDTDGSRILLGDGFGKLSILSLTRSTSETTLSLVRLGETSPATTITYLNSGVIFVGSHHGDSQIVRITPSADPIVGIQLDVLDSFKNIAPIMDAIFVDTENSGQAQVVTCSGYLNTGSLRIIRNGVGLEELATINGMTHAKHMWPLRFSYEAHTDNMLVVSTLQSTRFYSLANLEHGAIDEFDKDRCPGFSQEPTLALGNVASVILPTNASNGRTQYNDSQYVVQVTSTGVLLVNLFTGMRESAWQAETEVVAASVNASQVAVALKGRKLVILAVRDAQLIELRSRVFGDGEISTVTVHPYDQSLPFSNYIAVGFYESNTVSIVHAAELMRPLLSSISLPHLPVSLLLCQFGFDSTSRRRPIGHSKNHPTHILVGLGDGNLHVYSLDAVDGVANVGEQRVIPLGSTKPVFITPISPLQSAGVSEQCVLASGSRPIVLYWDNGRLKHSPLVRKGITAACPLDSKDFPSSIVFAINHEKEVKIGTTDLLIGRVRELQKLHIKTIPFGLDNPVRLSHHPQLKVLGVGCTRTQPHRVGEFAQESCSLKIVDDTTFEQLHHFPCDTDEEITVVETLSLSLDDSRIDQRPYLVVGTQYHQSGETEACKGRILLYEGRDPWLPEPQVSRQDIRISRSKVALATSFKVQGCVFAIAELGGAIAAAVNESVYILRLKTVPESKTMPSTHASGVELEVVARWTHNYIISNLVTRGDRIYTGDAICSLSVIQWDPSKQTLQNVARDHASLWPVAIQTLDKDNIIGCNNDCNLFVFNTNAAENNGLEQAGNYYVGDHVNKFLPGTLTSQSESNGAVRPEMMFMTSSGRIGVISELDEQFSLHMTALQRNLGYVVSGIGGVKHPKWRAPKNSRGISDSIGEASGFLDGDFLEHLLDFDNGSPEVEKAMNGNTSAEKLALPLSEAINVLEQLQAIH